MTAAFRLILLLFMGGSEHGHEDQAEEQTRPSEKADHDACPAWSGFVARQPTKRVFFRVIDPRSIAFRC